MTGALELALLDVIAPAVSDGDFHAVEVPRCELEGLLTLRETVLVVDTPDGPRLVLA